MRRPAESASLVDAVEVRDRALVDVVRRALRPCGLAVASDGAGLWAVVGRDDAGDDVISPMAYARRLGASELARWADGWLSAWRVWGAKG